MHDGFEFKALNTMQFLMQIFLQLWFGRVSYLRSVPIGTQDVDFFTSPAYL